MQNLEKDYLLKTKISKHDPGPRVQRKRDDMPRWKGIQREENHPYYLQMKRDALEKKELLVLKILVAFWMVIGIYYFAPDSIISLFKSFLSYVAHG